MFIDLPPQQPVVEWHEIVESSLRNDHLNADIRISDSSITVAESPSYLEHTLSFWGYFKKESLVGRDETLNNIEASLKSYFPVALETAFKGASMTGKEDTFAEETQSLLFSLLQKIEEEKVSLDKPTSQIIQEIDSLLLKSLFLLKAKYLSPSTTDSHSCPLPKTLVLSGGGIKGVGYIGAYKALEASGILNELDLVAGSSAGAATATFIALGLTGEALQQVSDTTDYDRLLTGHSHNSTIKEITRSDDNGLFDGSYAMNKVNTVILDTLTRYFQTTPFLEITTQLQSLKEQGLVTSEEEALLLELREAILTPQTLTKCLTFQELALLRMLNPSQFKNLTITGFNRTQGKEEYYNAENTPLMPIATAVRISMSLPGLYRPIKNDQGDELEDGGIGSNTPTEISPDPSTTLVCFFNKVPPKNLAPDWLQKGLGEAWSGNKHLQENNQQDCEKIEAAGFNALKIYHGSLDTASFLASTQEIHAVQRQAEVRMWEQLFARQDQMISCPISLE